MSCRVRLVQQAINKQVILNYHAVFVKSLIPGSETHFFATT